MFTGVIQAEESDRFEIKLPQGTEGTGLMHIPKTLMPKGSRVGSGVTVETSEGGLTVTVSEPQE